MGGLFVYCFGFCCCCCCCLFVVSSLKRSISFCAHKLTDYMNTSNSSVCIISNQACSLLPWRYETPAWTWPWATSSRWPYLSRGWTRWSPEVPSNLILWFCDLCWTTTEQFSLASLFCTGKSSGSTPKITASALQGSYCRAIVPYNSVTIFRKATPAGHARSFRFNHHSHPEHCVESPTHALHNHGRKDKNTESTSLMIFLKSSETIKCYVLLTCTEVEKKRNVIPVSLHGTTALRLCSCPPCRRSWLLGSRMCIRDKHKQDAVGCSDRRLAAKHLLTGCSSQSPELWNISPPPHPPTAGRTSLWSGAVVKLLINCSSSHRILFRPLLPPSPNKKLCQNDGVCPSFLLSFLSLGWNCLSEDTVLFRRATQLRPSLGCGLKPSLPAKAGDLHHSRSTWPKAHRSLKKLWQPPIQDVSPDIPPSSPCFPASAPALTPRPAAVQLRGLAPRCGPEERGTSSFLLPWGKWTAFKITPLSQSGLRTF